MDLDRAIDQKTDVADTETDDLNRVFHPERIVYQHQLVEETEAVESEESRNRLGRGTLVWLLLDLEICENITKSS